ncbi:MAG: phage major capsid protein, partial [Gemmatimonadetes bacterium]|nr:phage major capsid protein [Gemmatimonadota bacterium]
MAAGRGDVEASTAPDAHAGPPALQRGGKGADVARRRGLKAQRPAPGADGDNDPDKAEHKAAFGRYMRAGDDTGLREIERKVMRVGSDPDGGYLCPPEVSREIERITATEVAMRRVA